MFNKLLAAAVTLAFATGAFAAEHNVTITDAFVKPSVGEVGVAYFTITSSGNDAIAGIASDCCRAVELHRTEKVNGVMSMRRIGHIALKKNTPLAVQPDSNEHLMLIGLKEKLEAGDDVRITFSFDKAESQTVTLPVQTSATEAESHEHH